jgi:hypothetical protein
VPERGLFHGPSWQQIAGTMALQSHGMLFASHRHFSQLTLNGMLSFQIVNCVSLPACPTRAQMRFFKSRILVDVCTLKECEAMLAYSAVTGVLTN